MAIYRPMPPCAIKGVLFLPMQRRVCPSLSKRESKSRLTEMLKSPQSNGNSAGTSICIPLSETTRKAESTIDSVTGLFGGFSGTLFRKVASCFA